MSPNRDDEDDCSDEEEGLILKETSKVLQSSPSWRRVQRTRRRCSEEGKQWRRALRGSHQEVISFLISRDGQTGVAVSL